MGRGSKWRDQAKKKKEKELLETYNSVVIVWWGGCWVEVEEGIGGINNNGKINKKKNNYVKSHSVF